MEPTLAHLSSPDTPIAVIGLGYVGLPLAVEFGKQRPVIGFDISQARVAELQAGQDSTRETTPDDLAAARHLSCTSDTDALRACRIFIVTMPTPVDDAKRPDLTLLITRGRPSAPKAPSSSPSLTAISSNLRTWLSS